MSWWRSWPTNKLSQSPKQGLRICYSFVLRGVAQPGSASALGAEGREFESHRPDHFLVLFAVCGVAVSCFNDCARVFEPF